MTPYRRQSPAAPSAAAVSLEYESAERAAQRRRRTRLGRGAVAVAVLFAVLMLAVNYRSMRGGLTRWQRDRTMARAMAKPVGERFPDGQVTYAVPPGFHSRSSRRFPPVPSDYGPSSAASAAADAEWKAIVGGTYPRGPLLFLGALADATGERALVAIAFEHCSVQWRSPPSAPSGYYVSLWYTVRDLHGGGFGSGGGFPGTHLAPLSALAWSPAPQDDEVAALPLTFYSARVDPADPRVAVIPIKLGDRRGRLCASLSAAGRLRGLSTVVVWDE